MLRCVEDNDQPWSYQMSMEHSLGQLSAILVWTLYAMSCQFIVTGHYVLASNTNRASDRLFVQLNQVSQISKAKKSEPFHQHYSVRWVYFQQHTNASKLMIVRKSGVKLSSKRAANVS